MFTGLITALGQVHAISVAGGGARLVINAPAAWLSTAKIGDSIAVDGVCLTAESVNNDTFTVTLSAETLARCAPWQNRQMVNLEQSLLIGAKLGGHFVSGHVEDCARILAVHQDGDQGRRLTVAPPAKLLPLLISKGSVTLAGVSLTVCDLQAAHFAVHLVPHTLATTNLGTLCPDDWVNLETDILARHLARLHNFAAF